MSDRWHLHRHTIDSEQPVLAADVTKLELDWKDDCLVATISVIKNKAIHPIEVPMLFETNTQSYHGELDNFDLRFAFVEHDGVKSLIGHASDRCILIKRDLFVGLRSKSGGNYQPGYHEFTSTYLVPLDRRRHEKAQALILDDSKAEVHFQGRIYEVTRTKHDCSGWIYDGETREAPKETIHFWLLPTSENDKHWILTGYHHMDEMADGNAYIYTQPGNPICTKPLGAWQKKS
jgi:hypothetical protein